jgi:hypothetical protein
MSDNEIACSSCGLTMGQSIKLAESTPAELSLAERNVLSRLNDCNREITPADRVCILKLVEKLQWSK